MFLIFNFSNGLGESVTRMETKAQITKWDIKLKSFSYSFFVMFVFVLGHHPIMLRHYFDPVLRDHFWQAQNVRDWTPVSCLQDKCLPCNAIFSATKELLHIKKINHIKIKMILYLLYGKYIFTQTTLFDI